MKKSFPIKWIVGAVVLLICVVIAVLCLTKHTMKFSGVAVDGGQENNVTITLEIRKIDRLLGYKRVSGSITLQYEDSEKNVECKIPQSGVVKADNQGTDKDWYMLSFAGYNKEKNKMEARSMMFDRKFDNLVLEFGEAQIYAADAEFCKTIGMEKK